MFRKHFSFFKKQACSVEKKVFLDKAGDSQGFLWSYVMLLYLSIYFCLFYELFESSLEKGIFLVILMFRVFVKIISGMF